MPARRLRALDEAATGWPVSERRPRRVRLARGRAGIRAVTWCPRRRRVDRQRLEKLDALAHAESEAAGLGDTRIPALSRTQVTYPSASTSTRLGARVLDARSSSPPGRSGRSRFPGPASCRVVARPALIVEIDVQHDIDPTAPDAVGQRLHGRLGPELVEGGGPDVGDDAAQVRDLRIELGDRVIERRPPDFAVASLCGRRTVTVAARRGPASVSSCSSRAQRRRSSSVAASRARSWSPLTERAVTTALAALVANEVRSRSSSSLNSARVGRIGARPGRPASPCGRRAGRTARRPPSNPNRPSPVSSKRARFSSSLRRCGLARLQHAAGHRAIRSALSARRCRDRPPPATAAIRRRSPTASSITRAPAPTSARPRLAISCEHDVEVGLPGQRPRDLRRWPRMAARCARVRRAGHSTPATRRALPIAIAA